MEIEVYEGCGNCRVRDRCDSLSKGVFKAKVVGPILWDNCGKMVNVFHFGDIIDVKLNFDSKTQIAFCGIAESTIFPGVSDFIDLDKLLFVDTIELGG